MRTTLIHTFCPRSQNSQAFVEYDLRDGGHSHELIAHKYKMTHSSFIVRTLFDNM